MSEYKVQDYINKKWNDIAKDIPTVKAYNLGVAVGLLECYKQIKILVGEKEANKIYKTTFDGKEEFNTIFRTLVGLYNDDSNSKVDSIIEAFEKSKKPDKEMQDEHRDLIEEFLEFLHKKEDISNV